MNWQERNQPAYRNQIDNHLAAKGFQQQQFSPQVRQNYPPQIANNYEPAMPNYNFDPRPNFPVQNIPSPRYLSPPQLPSQPPIMYSPSQYERQNQYYSINENLYNNYFLPNNLFYMNSFYARQNGNQKKDNASTMLQPSVLERPTYFGQNKSDEDEILDYIRDMIAFDYQLEKLKLQLLSYNDFAISDAFTLFDLNKTGQVSLKELKEGFNKINIYAEDSDLFLLANRFSRDGNNVLRLVRISYQYLSFDEFTLLFIPFSGQPTKTQITKSNYLGDSNFLVLYQLLTYVIKQMSHLTQKALTALMKQHLNIEFSLEQIRQNIALKKVDVQKAFAKIDQNNSELVSADEFMKYLKKKQIQIDSTILLAIMFRFDRNLSGKVNKQEFMYEFHSKLKKRN